MFTGLIETVGKALRLERLGSAGRLAVATDLPQDDIRPGDSVAVNGVCLTVVAQGRETLTFDVSPETLERSTFCAFSAGMPVNLERAMRLSDRLGGHIVAGHVDCVATIVERSETSGNIAFTFRLPPHAVRYLVEKGSVAIDGISLTVNTVERESFTVNIIPHTAARTTLALKRSGDLVNIETDILGKYVESLLSGKQEGNGGLTLELLAKNGFV
ncbi:MAG: riboflavin synthase [Geobacteraceae bacterium]